MTRASNDKHNERNEVSIKKRWLKIVDEYGPNIL